PPDAVVVLLVEQARLTGGVLEVVHAEARVPVGGGRRVVVPLAVGGVGQVVAPLPRHAAVLGGEDPGGGDPHPHPLGVLRVGDDGVQDQAGRAGAPLPGGRVVGQP